MSENIPTPTYFAPESFTVLPIKQLGEMANLKPNDDDLKELRPKVNELLNNSNLLDLLLVHFNRAMYGWEKSLPRSVRACLALSPITNAPFIVEYIHTSTSTEVNYMEPITTRGNMNIFQYSQFGGTGKSRLNKIIEAQCPRSINLMDVTSGSWEGLVGQPTEGEDHDITKRRSKGLGEAINEALIITHEASTFTQTDQYRARNANIVKTLIEDGSVNSVKGGLYSSYQVQVAILTSQTSLYEDGQLRTRFVPIYVPAGAVTAIEVVCRKLDNIPSYRDYDAFLGKTGVEVPFNKIVRNMFWDIMKEVKGLPDDYGGERIPINRIDFSANKGDESKPDGRQIVKFHWIKSFLTYTPNAGEAREILKNVNPDDAKDMKVFFSEKLSNVYQILSRKNVAEAIDGGRRVLDDVMRLIQKSALVHFRNRKIDQYKLSRLSWNGFKGEPVVARVLHANIEDVILGVGLIDYLMEFRLRETLYKKVPEDLPIPIITPLDNDVLFLLEAGEATLTGLADAVFGDSGELAVAKIGRCIERLKKVNKVGTKEHDGETYYISTKSLGRTGLIGKKAVAIGANSLWDAVQSEGPPIERGESD